MELDAHKWTDGRMHRQMDGWMDIQTYEKTESETDIQRQADINADRQIYKQAGSVMMTTNNLKNQENKKSGRSLSNYRTDTNMINLYHANLLHVEISTEVYTCLNSRCEIQWIPEYPVMIGRCCDFLNTLLGLIYLSIAPRYTYIVKRCFMNFD